MIPKNVLFALASASVLNRNTLIDLTADGIAEVFSEINKHNQPLLVVQNTDGFFTPQNLVNLLKEHDPRSSLVAEQLGLKDFLVAPAQVAVMKEQAAAPVQQKVADDGGLIVKKGVPIKANGYAFGEVPDGWSVGNNMSLGQTKIRRKVNGKTSIKGFCTSPEVFQEIWNKASKFWAGHGVQTFYIDNRRTRCTNSEVNFDGSLIRRYELEQVALYRGWDFPAPAGVMAA